MQLARFKKLTNAFSKKLPHLSAARRLHVSCYSFYPFHSSLGVTPVVATGDEVRNWELRELLAQFD
jgi:hypothetical protein